MYHYSRAMHHFHGQQRWKFVPSTHKLRFSSVQAWLGFSTYCVPPTPCQQLHRHHMMQVAFCLLMPRCTVQLLLCCSFGVWISLCLFGLGVWIFMLMSSPCLRQCPSSSHPLKVSSLSFVRGWSCGLLSFAWAQHQPP